MTMFKILNKNRGFTILEVLVTMLVLIIGGLAAYAMVQQIVFDTFASNYRITAAYLAKEGIEIVRNTRDTNWLKDAPSWNDGISDISENDVLSNYDRNTTISSNPDGSIKVSVEVSWDIRGDDGTITVQENLYNWY